jgi:hypothetical protein
MPEVFPSAAWLPSPFLATVSAFPDCPVVLISENTMEYVFGKSFIFYSI